MLPHPGGIQEILFTLYSEYSYFLITTNLI